MAQLVPCPQCERHVRLSTASCPFCDVALDVSGLSEQYAARRVTAQPGLKRAAMFALGASVVAACSGDPGQAIYGAPVSPTSDETSSATSDTSSSDTTMTTEPDAGQVALYGGPPTSAELDGGAADDAGANDGGDSSSVDASSGDAAIPEDTTVDSIDTGPVPGYGAPVPPPEDTTLEPLDPGPLHIYGAPPLPLDDAPRR
jgi:hypothetical protein